MKKLLLGLWLLPIITWAQDATTNLFNFNPPLTDISVVFLEDLFGVVDGVFSGTGSQMMGNMFSVFNAAVLAIGGIVIMYTLIVGTMNTAQEGEMLGHKWSSIWVPLRATLGLALLMPKASGYCLMQIFVMWVIVQGVGAADKVWDAALAYLNRGGVIIQAQNYTAVTSSSNLSAIANGASAMLAGQVCMLGLQQQLETQRVSFNNSKDINTNICSGTPSGEYEQFCNQSVPSFLDTVNFIEQQNSQSPPPAISSTTPTKYTAPMPNFPSKSPYAAFNAICGTMTWQSINSLTSSSGTITYSNTSNSSSSSVESESAMQSMQMARPIALQQMYTALAIVAQDLIGNDPQLNTANAAAANTNFSTIAVQEYGVPYTSNGIQCTSSSSQCASWGIDQQASTQTAPLFTGSEFVSAINTYNASMMPTLNLLKEMQNAQQAQSARSFISSAQSQGWLSAGSYFFDLVNLNGNALANSADTDYNIGLPTAPFNINNLTQPFTSNSCGNYCVFFNNSETAVDQIVSLINGNNVANVPSGGIAAPNITTTSSMPVITGASGSTVYGFINNASMVQLPGQPGMFPPNMVISMNITTPTTLLKFPTHNSGCSFPFCIVSSIDDFFFNVVIGSIINFFMVTVAGFFMDIIEVLLDVPLQMFVVIFQNGVEIISNSGANPIVSLAQMGTAYINTTMELWLQFFTLGIIVGIIPGLIFTIMLIMPIIISWMAVMVTIGFITAYYVPFVPYLVFTFGVIAWLMAVIEAMAAAPIVALGITHPEGEGILGKGEQGLMILMNVFLRPALMVIGFIGGFALCYVSVWVLNTGFQTVASYMSDSKTAVSTGYSGWASLYAGFFTILIYTTSYLTVVQRSFTLIHSLPDKVMRWIGGQGESTGQEISQMTEESRGQIKEGGGEASKGGASVSGKMSGKTQKTYTELSSKASEYSNSSNIEGGGS